MQTHANKMNIIGGDSRNYTIDLIKTCMSFVIVFYHYNNFYLEWSNQCMVLGGYIAVDLFFVISGYFFAASRAKRPEQGFFQFALGKLKTLYLPYFTVFLFALGVYWLTDRTINLKDLILDPPKENPVLGSLGNFSFLLYLLHMPVYYAMRLVFPSFSAARFFLTAVFFAALATSIQKKIQTGRCRKEAK